jgi:RND family efflux transporter MFP subunit
MPNKNCIAMMATLGFSLALIVSCSRQIHIEARGDPAQTTTVAVAKAVLSDLSHDLILTAEFRPFQEIDVHAKVAGYVKKMYVDVGDRVKEGQLLAILEIPEMVDDLARASAGRRRSDADVLHARDELRRAQSAHEASHLSYTRLAAVSKARPNLVAQQELDDSQARDLVSEAQVAAAKSALASAEQQVQVASADEDKVKTLNAYARITAPFTGVITKRYADTGAMVQQGTASQTQAMPVVRLSENSLLRLVLPVPETVVPTIHLGEAVEVRVPSLNRSFQGKVARFSDRVQFSTRTMETEVDVSNPSLVLIPGMYAEAHLTLEKKTQVLAVPVQAMGGHENNPSVMVVNADKRLEERPVKRGLETSNRVEILSGLHENEMVVVGSRSQLKAGQQVEPKIIDPVELKEQP